MFVVLWQVTKASCTAGCSHVERLLHSATDMFCSLQWQHHHVSLSVHQVKKGSSANPEGAPDATWWLREGTMRVGPGELVGGVGRVGSGKSSLIGALRGKSFLILHQKSACSLLML